MSKSNQIPLEERLKLLSRGYASDEMYNHKIIHKMANIPIKSYLKDFPNEYVQLKALLELTDLEMEHARYKDIAMQICDLPNSKDAFESNYIRSEAIYILAMPFLRCYEKRAWIYEKYRKN